MTRMLAVRSVLVACLLAVGLMGPWLAGRTHGQTEGITSTYTYDRTSSVLTIHLRIDTSDFPTTPPCIIFHLPDALGLLQGPPGWRGEVVTASGGLGVYAGTACVQPPTAGAPPLQIGTDYTFVIQMRPGTAPPGTIDAVTIHVNYGNGLATAHGFTVSPGAPVIPTATSAPPPPAATATRVPTNTAVPAATATTVPTAVPTSVPTEVATAVPGHLRIRLRGTLHVGKSGTLTVLVQNADDGSAVEGARVTLDARKAGIAKVRHATTSAKGQAQFKKLGATKAATITIRATADGFTTASAHARVSP